MWATVVSNIYRSAPAGGKNPLGALGVGDGHPATLAPPKPHDDFWTAREMIDDGPFRPA
jgi:hypothetical protein